MEMIKKITKTLKTVRGSGFSRNSGTVRNPYRLAIKAANRARARDRRKYRDEVLRPKWAAKAAAK